MRACTALFLFVILCASQVKAPEYKNFEQSVVERSSSAKYALPSVVLDMLSEAVEFALTSGAAGEVSQQDLFHAHLLASQGAGLAALDAVLLHTQEMVSLSEEAFKKRNVVLFRGKRPEILGCSVGKSHRRFFPPEEWPKLCVVDEHDLGLKNPADVYIIRADYLTARELASLANNTRVIRGQKILFISFGLVVKNGRLTLP